MMRAAKGILALLAAGLVAATSAYAAVAMNVSVTNSQITMAGGAGGTCEWSVVSTVTLVNLSGAPVNVTAVDTSADYELPGDVAGRVNSEIIDDAGLAAGVTLAPNAIATFPGVETRSFIPCDAVYAQMEFRISSPGGVNAGDAPFLENGTSVPFRTIAGGAALAMAIAAAFVVHERRRRAQALAPATTVTG